MLLDLLLALCVLTVADAVAMTYSVSDISVEFRDAPMQRSGLSELSLSASNCESTMMMTDPTCGDAHVK